MRARAPHLSGGGWGWVTPAMAQARKRRDREEGRSLNVLQCPWCSKRIGNAARLVFKGLLGQCGCWRACASRRSCQDAPDRQMVSAMPDILSNFYNLASRTSMHVHFRAVQLANGWVGGERGGGGDPQRSWCGRGPAQPGAQGRGWQAFSAHPHSNLVHRAGDLRIETARIWAVKHVWRSIGSAYSFWSSQLLA